MEIAIQEGFEQWKAGLGEEVAGSFRQRLEWEVVRHGPEAEVDGATGGARRGMMWRPEQRSRVGSPTLRGTSAYL